jgi:hypothetical protein
MFDNSYIMAGYLNNLCPHLNKPACGVYNTEVSDSSLRDWLDGHGVSAEVRPLICRTYPHFVFRQNQMSTTDWLRKPDETNELESSCFARRKISITREQFNELNNEIRLLDRISRSTYLRNSDELCTLLRSQISNPSKKLIKIVLSAADEILNSENTISSSNDFNFFF